MNINLRSDAKKHNLALMKISTLHKAQGDNVYLNMVGSFDLIYGSWLFDFTPKEICDIEGGPGIDPAINLNGFSDCRPDYDLYGLDFSLGYTWRYCPRKCEFCIVPKQRNPKSHNSIWDFHNSKFKKICLLNNNTFSDPQWKETFEEIWDADLTVIDENGYDLRLMDEEKAAALKKTKWDNKLHFAWDNMKDEARILNGLFLAKSLKLNNRGMVYVLVGYDTSLEEDLYRCQKIHDAGFSPYIMPFRKSPEISKLKEFVNVRAYWKYETVKQGFADYKGRSHGKQLRKFKRFIDSRMYRKYKTIEDAWMDYGKTRSA